MTPPPILVTGTHRSGSTWVGEMLSLSSQAHYVHEPFAPMYERSWMLRPPANRFHHEPPSRRGPYAEDLERICRLRPPWLRIALRSHHPRHVARLLQEAYQVRHARRAGARAVIKDPFALLSAEWIARHSGADVVVLVRHPAAFASSIKRLGWRLDVSWLLGQDELVHGDLGPFVADLRSADDLDLVDHACLVWRVLNTVVLRYQAEHPTWTIERYEDLAAAPVSRFRSLYEAVGLSWDEVVAARIEARSSRSNPAEVEPRGRGGTTRDSRQAMWTWVNRLTTEEVERIRDRTEDLASRWYTAVDWTVPQQMPAL